MFFDLDKAALPKPSLLNAIVAPRPIAWVSTLSKAGTTSNLAPFSYFNLLTNSPPTVMFSCVNPSDRREKDTLRNIRSTREYVINMVSRDLLEPMHASSRPAPYGTSEFDMVGVRRTPSETVAPPRVEGVPAALECRLLRLVRIPAAHAGELGCTAVIGRIVGLYVAPHLLGDDGRFRSHDAGLVARLGGNLYSEFGVITELASVAS